VCRRGCNTRTTTYTPEFVWEHVYQGAKDLSSLNELVESQTKATRKRGRPRKDAVDRDDFVEPDSDDDGAPRTPRKRRKLHEATTPTSTRNV
jgi:origin recognition complex subunit 1